MKRTVEIIDNEIKKRVQAVESEIPSALETEFMNRLDQQSPEPPQRLAVRHRYAGVLAAAASVLLAAFLLGPLLFRSDSIPASGSPEGDEVFIDLAQVEGMPANTYIMSKQDPDVTIVWIEKAPVVANNRDAARPDPATPTKTLFKEDIDES